VIRRGPPGEPRPRIHPAADAPRHLRLRPAHDVRGTHGASLPRHFAAADEQRDGRDAANVEPRAHALCLVRIHLDELHARLEFRCGLLEGRRHHPARAAPGRPEVHQHGQLAARDVALELGGIEIGGMAGEEGLVAAAAIRRIREVRGLDPVGGVAVRTDDVQLAHVVFRCPLRM
jgi:hypothetical protein